MLTAIDAELFVATGSAAYSYCFEPLKRWRTLSMVEDVGDDVEKGEEGSPEDDEFDGARELHFEP